MSGVETRIAHWRRQGWLNEVDGHLARMLARRHPAMGVGAALAAALLSQALEEGHTCLPLAQIAATLTARGEAISVQGLQDQLWASAAVVAPEHAAERPAPMVLDAAQRLALLRWHRAESRIAAELVRRAGALTEVDEERAQQMLARLVPESPDAPNLQKTAAALALCKRLLILCGGPGTGKTWTLARMLALCSALTAGQLRVALAAPTGRAAMRLGEAIREAAAAMPEDIGRQALPEAETLHRLLGYQPQTGRFRRNADNPLPADLVIVDEASMVDDLLLDALLAAVPAGCRLVLCGDPGQLPPVAPGSLLHSLAGLGAPGYAPALRAACARLCGRDMPEPPDAAVANLLNECRITLKKAHRFDETSGISALAAALQDADPAAELKRVLSRSWPDITLLGTETARSGLPAILLEMFRPLYRAATAAEAMAAFARCRVLCALREGPWGVAGINRLCRELLRRQGLVPARQEWHRGLPVLIQHNAHDLRLYNGDTGMLWPDENAVLRAWFAAEGGLRPFPPAALPAWQPAWAITVHKAQGAEFDDVMLVLPEGDSPLLTRELLYTAVTRARKRLVLVAGPEVLERSAVRQLQRYSALGDLLSAFGKPPIFIDSTSPNE